jgi:hypothetical protein
MARERRDRLSDRLQRQGAIASSGMGAFIGFACQDFMRFDYLLGRQNCQKFLREEFLLSADNPLFSGWTLEEKNTFADPANPGMLPIIPLVGDVTAEQTLADWPTGALNPEDYRKAVEARFRAIFQLELSGNPLKATIAWAGALITEGQAADYVINAMNRYLRTACL